MKKPMSKRLKNIGSKVYKRFQTTRSNLKAFKTEIVRTHSSGKRMSKRRSAIFGFATLLGIFGITWSLTMAPAIAKDIPKNASAPGPVPTPANSGGMVQAKKKEVNSLLSGSAMTLCAGAVSIGSFTVGALCGIVVIVGILHSRNN